MRGRKAGNIKVVAPEKSCIKSTTSLQFMTTRIKTFYGVSSSHWLLESVTGLVLVLHTSFISLKALGLRCLRSLTKHSLSLSKKEGIEVKKEQLKKGRTVAVMIKHSWVDKTSGWAGLHQAPQSLITNINANGQCGVTRTWDACLLR